MVRCFGCREGDRRATRSKVNGWSGWSYRHVLTGETEYSVWAGLDWNRGFVEATAYGTRETVDPGSGEWALGLCVPTTCLG